MNQQHQNKENIYQKNKYKWFDCILYYAAVFVMPGILLLNLYNQNYTKNYLIYNHILIISGLLAIAGVLFFCICKIILKSNESAIIVCLFFWGCFWFYEKIKRIISYVIPAISGADIALIIALILFVLALICFLRNFKPPLHNFRPAFVILLFCILGLFMINLLPGVSYNIKLKTAKVDSVNIDSNDLPYIIKRDFVIDPDLPKPDIYWIHADAMMNLETVESYWDVDLTRIRDNFARRSIYYAENAQIPAGTTYRALTALLSPTFYDSYFYRLLEKYRGELRQIHDFEIDDLAAVGLTYTDDIAPYFELLSALYLTGYKIIINDMDTYMPDNFDYLSGDNSYLVYQAGAYNSFIRSDLPDLLSLTTPLRYPPKKERLLQQAQQTQPESTSNLDSDAPVFTWYMFDDTHMDNVWLFDPSADVRDHTAINSYIFAYNSMISKIFALIDKILNENDDVVIIIQADHGFHLYNTHQYLLNVGYPVESINELTYSVFSAVYISPGLDSLDKALAPLNISRVLVNRFIGNNYNLLSDD